MIFIYCTVITTIELIGILLTYKIYTYDYSPYYNIATATYTIAGIQLPEKLFKDMLNLGLFAAFAVLSCVIYLAVLFYIKSKKKKDKLSIKKTDNTLTSTDCDALDILLCADCIDCIDIFGCNSCVDCGDIPDCGDCADIPDCGDCADCVI